MELDPQPAAADGAQTDPPVEPHASNKADAVLDTSTEHMDGDNAAETPVQSLPPNALRPEAPDGPDAPNAAEPKEPTEPAEPAEAQGAKDTTVERVARFLATPPTHSSHLPTEGTMETGATAGAETEAEAVDRKRESHASNPPAAPNPYESSNDIAHNERPQVSSSPQTQSNEGLITSHLSPQLPELLPTQPLPPPPPPPQQPTQLDKNAYTGKSFSDEHAEPTLSAATQQPRLEDETTDTASSLFSTGLSIDSDADSALGDVDAPSSTQSVRSSIYEFVEENGRTFHKYKQGKYFMPNDKSEQERLDLQHAIFVLLLKGQLARAPIEDPQRVLDVGTGTGIWAIEFAQAHPAAQVIGTDLSPIQPDFVPPNCRFEIDDAEDDWTYASPFDFVHLRLLWHSFHDPRRILQSAYDHLRPGGYVEWQDYMSRFRAVDDSLQGSALTRLDTLYAAAGRRLGRDMLVTPKLAGMMRDVGFVDVVEERYALPGNPWPKGRAAKTLGLWQMTNFLDGMQAITMTVLTRGLGMTPAEVELLLMDVRKDVQNTNVHFYIPVYVMYGRKPYPHEVPKAA
ncbi:hypothetical protein SPBR_04152 [Sporothrix brasiliensis 5110]|uniref:Methyltransferase type 12 n=1 Tax=Sporothrix brasiliensis 5110 TaxID=1398154 RepID=A0A0C2J2W7_9PEZI|nr:uncharacterized protein SPBR_04152 [Sporothrix brasiliensis 5110]KIH93385.1 hypothetical protein SPBR_04152 [Sporothrix brasiliensis 5110]